MCANEQPRYQRSRGGATPECGYHTGVPARAQPSQYPHIPQSGTNPFPDSYANNPSVRTGGRLRQRDAPDSPSVHWETILLSRETLVRRRRNTPETRTRPVIRERSSSTRTKRGGSRQWAHREEGHGVTRRGAQPRPRTERVSDRGSRADCLQAPSSRRHRHTCPGNSSLAGLGRTTDAGLRHAAEGLTTPLSVCPRARR